jgi:hypothetical protein
VLSLQNSQRSQLENTGKTDSAPEKRKTEKFLMERHEKRLGYGGEPWTPIAGAFACCPRYDQ